MTDKNVQLMNRDHSILWKPTGALAPKKVGGLVCSFLDTATTSMGRATHYNTREEQQKAEIDSHNGLAKVSRDLYAVLLALPGVTDRSMGIGLKTLLSSQRNGKDDEFLDAAKERAVLYHLIQSMPPQRMLKLVDAFRVGDEELGLAKANNARTRKLVLRTLLSSPRLQLWSIKYRSKMKSSFNHVWGRSLTTVIRKILTKTPSKRTNKELGILNRNIKPFCRDEKSFVYACECVGFVLGIQKSLKLPMLKAFVSAKKDITSAKNTGLPMEVLEGIRSTFHPNVTHADVLELSKNTMTATQKKNVQRSAKAAGVKVDMDPTQYNPVDLYLYAFAMGMTSEISDALAIKARKLAAGFPAHYGKVAIIVDASASMAGDITQPLRPMACALAMRDMLECVGDDYSTVYVGGNSLTGHLIQPSGDTALADRLVEVLSEDAKPDCVFVLSDGYENTPAGRFAEVVKEVREIGIDTPIYHLNPVFAAETKGCRELAPQQVNTLPVKSPEGLGTTIIRGLVETDPIRGINALVRLALVAGPVELKALANS